MGSAQLFVTTALPTAVAVVARVVRATVVRVRRCILWFVMMDFG